MRLVDIYSCTRVKVDGSSEPSCDICGAGVIDRHRIGIFVSYSPPGLCPQEIAVEIELAKKGITLAIAGVFIGP